MTSSRTQDELQDGLNWSALNRLKLRHFVLYRNVCESASVSRAAELSHMTQPGATRLIHEMEEMFNARLFDRGKSGTEPTIYGMALLRYVRLVLADIDEARTHLDALVKGESGMVRIGHIPTVPAEICANACIALRAMYPKVNVTITEGRSDMLIDELRRGELDMALARVVSQTDIEGLSTREVYDEPFSAVACIDAGGSRAQPMSWTELARQDWVLPAKGSLSRLAVDLAFVKNGLPGPRAAVECQTLEQLRYHVIKGRLFGVLPAADALRLQRQKVLKVVRSNIAPHLAPVSLLLRSEREIAPAVAQLAEFITSCAARHTVVRGPTKL